MSQPSKWLNSDEINLPKEIKSKLIKQRKVEFKKANPLITKPSTTGDSIVTETDKLDYPITLLEVNSPSPVLEQVPTETFSILDKIIPGRQSNMSTTQSTSSTQNTTTPGDVYKKIIKPLYPEEVPDKRGVLDSKGVWTALFQTRAAYGKFFVKTAEQLGKHFFNVDVIPFIYPLCEAAVQMRSNRGNNPLTWFVLDAFMPFIDDSQYLTPQEATDFVNQYAVAGFTAEVKMIMCDDRKDIWAELKAAIPDLPSTAPNTIKAITSEYKLTTEQTKIAWGILAKWLSDNSENTVLKEFNRQIKMAIFSGIIAVAKRGNATDEWLIKQSTEVAKEVGESKFQLLKITEMEYIFSQINGMMTKENMADLYKRWNEYCAAETMPLHLRLIVERMEYQGIAAFRFIREAIRRYPDFPWGRVYDAYPGQFKAFTSAVEEIGEGKFAGFMIDNKKWKSTLFRQVAWISWMLIQKISIEDRPAKNYLGFPNSAPINKDQWIELIDKYIKNSTVDTTADGYKISSDAESAIEKIKSIVK